MNRQDLIKKWFRKVDIFPPPWTGGTVENFRAFWRVAYRDARQYAHIAHHANNELRDFRGFGVLKKVWALSGNCIGRVRTNDLASFNNWQIAEQAGYDDYNPNRILKNTVENNQFKVIIQKHSKYPEIRKRVLETEMAVLDKYLSN
jgi:hypothetical protein